MRPPSEAACLCACCERLLGGGKSGLGVCVCMCMHVLVVYIDKVLPLRVVVIELLTSHTCIGSYSSIQLASCLAKSFIHCVLLES